MDISIYQVDAFAESVFSGNPAAVCPLDEWLEDEVMQQIASENNLSETAFFVRNGDDFDLRWFTPTFEIDLCGHATLASAHVLFNHLSFEGDTIRFQTKSGELRVTREGDLMVMDFPSRPPEKITPPKELILGLGMEPTEVWKSRDMLALYDREEEVQALEPDFHILETLDVVGIIATAPGDDVDFISRFFAPRAGVNEDPVTGSAHSTLIPFWSGILGKKSMKARQISPRGGNLECELLEDRVLIKGSATTYLSGTIQL